MCRHRLSEIERGRAWHGFDTVPCRYSPPPPAYLHQRQVRKQPKTLATAAFTLIARRSGLDKLDKLDPLWGVLRPTVRVNRLHTFLSFFNSFCLAQHF